MSGERSLSMDLLSAWLLEIMVYCNVIVATRLETVPQSSICTKGTTIRCLKSTSSAN